VVRKKSSLNQKYIKSIVKNAMLEDLRPYGDVTTQLIKNKKKLKQKLFQTKQALLVD